MESLEVLERQVGDGGGVAARVHAVSVVGEDGLRGGGGVPEKFGTVSGGEGGGSQFVHGRSPMTIDPRIPSYAGTEHVGFSPTRQLGGGGRGVPSLCMAVVA